MQARHGLMSIRSSGPSHPSANPFRPNATGDSRHARAAMMLSALCRRAVNYGDTAKMQAYIDTYHPPKSKPRIISSAIRFPAICPSSRSSKDEPNHIVALRGHMSGRTTCWMRGGARV